MHDEAAEHADHLLHGHVGVVEVGALLVDVELVDEAAAGRDGLLADAGLAVVADRDLRSRASGWSLARADGCRR